MSDEREKRVALVGRAASAVYAQLEANSPTVHGKDDAVSFIAGRIAAWDAAAFDADPANGGDGVGLTEFQSRADELRSVADLVGLISIDGITTVTRDDVVDWIVPSAFPQPIKTGDSIRRAAAAKVEQTQADAATRTEVHKSDFMEKMINAALERSRKFGATGGLKTYGLKTESLDASRARMIERDKAAKRKAMQKKAERLKKRARRLRKSRR